jgi:hypothetical protein
MAVKDADEATLRLGKIADYTGIPIEKLAETTAKLNLRQAGFGEMLAAAQIMGPDIQQMALDYNQMTVNAPLIAEQETIAAETFHRHSQDVERAAELQGKEAKDRSARQLSIAR